MQIYSILIALYSTGVTRALAANDLLQRTPARYSTSLSSFEPASSAPKIATAVSNELKATAVQITEPETSTNASQIASSSFDQSLVTSIINFQAVCEYHNTQDSEGRTWKYTFNRADCDASTGSRRLMKITCYTRFIERDNPRYSISAADRTFSYVCPVNTVCARIRLVSVLNPRGWWEIACVDEAEMHIDSVVADTSTTNSIGVHCGLSLAIPGTQYKVKPGIDSIDLILTEEVRYPDGSPYPAPQLFIREESSRWGKLNRVYTQQSSVASAQVTLTSVRGKFQTRTFQFCMQLMPGMAGPSAIFMYSWFQIGHKRRGNIPLLEAPNNVTVL